MPQDIPLEASETLAFTPPSLAALDNPPVFMLRAASLREKRARARMLTEAGIITHSQAELREEAKRGLKALWAPEDVDRYLGYVTDYWQAVDDFALQQADQPDLVFAYDPDIEAKTKLLISKVEREWAPLASMVADIRDASQVGPLSYLAVAIADWTGVDGLAPPARGFMSLDTADRLSNALLALDTKAKSSPYTAYGELYLACMRRFVLDEEEGKNSESPSPSETTQAPSTETTTSAKVGKSPASARSKKTPVSA